MHRFTQNLSERKGVVSNLHGFLNVDFSTGYSSKWSGLWVPPHKMMDYVAFRIDGDWLGPDTVTGTEYGDRIRFHHRMDDLKIVQEISAPKRRSGARIRLEVQQESHKTPLEVTGELGIDIRRRDEDINTEEYKVQKEAGLISFRRGGQKLVASSKNGLDIQNKYMKTHYPGEKQRCLVAQTRFRNKLEKGEPVRLELTTSDGFFGSIEQPEQRLESELGPVFGGAVNSIRNLTYDYSGTGIAAGHPWFQSYWARDSFWTLLGAIDAGMFQLARDVLSRFVEEDLCGRIKADGKTENGMRSDTEPLFLVAADKLRHHDRLNNTIRDGIRSIDTPKTENGVVNNHPEGTWMDTLERNSAVEIQSLWLEAAKRWGLDCRKKLEEGLERFKTNSYIKDTEKSRKKTINPAVPLMFGQIQHGKALDTMNSELISEYGARTLSESSPEYDPSGYHTGSTWGLTTAWAAAANITAGRDEKGTEILKKFGEFSYRGQPGALPENIDSRTGKVLGCSEQAWSAGMTAHVIDSYILGVEVEGEKVRIDPVEGLTARRTGKRIKDERIDFRVHNGKTELLNSPDIDVEVIR